MRLLEKSAIKKKEGLSVYILELNNLCCYKFYRRAPVLKLAVYVKGWNVYLWDCWASTTHTIFSIHKHIKFNYRFNVLYNLP